MSDFDMDAFDSIDFDSVEQSVAEKQAEKDKQESQEIEVCATAPTTVAIAVLFKSAQRRGS